jgi:hypothetical protein
MASVAKLLALVEAAIPYFVLWRPPLAVFYTFALWPPLTPNLLLPTGTPSPFVYAV